ncbi:MAG: sigma-70 family RNA polymerase sigma factor [Clostridia bacterium]|nr:sigma-70 family RNA polymerase sigma factor [Clostridia bacterium]
MEDCCENSIQNESERALKRMAEMYRTPLTRMCCVWLKDADLAEDAAQETFLRAYRAYASFRGECSEKTWLMKIAVNVCRNMKRSFWARHVDNSVEIEKLPLASAPPEPRDGMLLRSVLRLGTHEREVILLYYYQDMKLEEIAASLDASVSAVSRRLKKARAKLLDALEEEERV